MLFFLLNLILSSSIHPLFMVLLDFYLQKKIKSTKIEIIEVNSKFGWYFPRLSKSKWGSVLKACTVIILFGAPPTRFTGSFGKSKYHYQFMIEMSWIGEVHLEKREVSLSLNKICFDYLIGGLNRLTDVMAASGWISRGVGPNGTLKILNLFWDIRFVLVTLSFQRVWPEWTRPWLLAMLFGDFVGKLDGIFSSFVLTDKKGL